MKSCVCPESVPTGPRSTMRVDLTLLGKRPAHTLAMDAVHRSPLTSARRAIFVTKTPVNELLPFRYIDRGKTTGEESSQHEHHVKNHGITPPKPTIAEIRRSKFRVEAQDESTGTRLEEVILRNSLHVKFALCGHTSCSIFSTDFRRGADRLVAASPDERP